MGAILLDEEPDEEYAEYAAIISPDGLHTAKNCVCGPRYKFESCPDCGITMQTIHQDINQEDQHEH